jgi:hypothetical protein
MKRKFCKTDLKFVGFLLCIVTISPQALHFSPKGVVLQKIQGVSPGNIIHHIGYATAMNIPSTAKIWTKNQDNTMVGIKSSIVFINPVFCALLII